MTVDGSFSSPVLWHIGISHYSEKVRWALAHKSVSHVRRAPLPGLHAPIALVLTRGEASTLPVLRLDGVPITDSTAIIAALEDRYPDPALYPADPAERTRALALEEFLDEELGPYSRLLCFHEARSDPAILRQIAAQSAPTLTAWFGPVTVPYTRVLTAARYRAHAADAAAVARQKILAALDRIERELGDRDYLVGDRFTVADLTAAALLYPVVRPSGAPTPGDVPASLEPFRDTLRERRVFRWVQDLYGRHR